jgi:ribonuclease HI
MDTMLFTLDTNQGYIGHGLKQKLKSRASARTSLDDIIADGISAKFKKFPSEAAAQAYMTGSSAPYTVPSRSASEPKAGPSNSHRQPTQPSRASAQTRAVSPPTAIDPSLLPPNLQDIAKKGYTFSKDQRLVVYTDGSGLGNGQAGARAGLGVFWGCEGEAGRKNLAERVPGDLQTNNRGELLVSFKVLAVYSTVTDLSVSHQSR